jgi:uroporphyrinogen-III synthase
LKIDPAPLLQGRVVAITRPIVQNKETAKLVEDLGGVPLIAPTVEIRPPEDRREVEEFIRGVTRGDQTLLVFLSVNSVRSLFQVAEDAGLADDIVNGMEEITVVAIGSKTLEALRALGVETIIVPDDQSSQGVVNSLIEMGLKGLRIGIPRSSKADETLRRALEARGAVVHEVTAYESGLPREISPAIGLIVALGKGQVDAVTFTSASTGRNLFEIADAHASSAELEEGLRGAVVAAIGPATREALKELGVRVDVVPREPSTEALIGALAEKLNLDKGEWNAERTRKSP